MRKFDLKLTTAIVFSLFASPAFAQDNAETTSSVTTLETVEAVNERIYDAITTEKTRDYSSFASTVGTKRPAALREIPQSITVITNQQMVDRNVNTLDQLASKTPGLRVLPNDDGRSSVYARGYEYSEYNIDGLPAQMTSISGGLPNLIVFDRVEIMRGPSGLFDSSGEMGGIINFVRKRPTKEFAGSIGAGYGSSKRYNIDGDISGSLNSSGSARGRVIAQTNGVSYKPAEKNNHNETFYTAFDWDITPQTTLGLGYLYQQRHLSPDNGLPAYADLTLLPLPQDVFVGADWNKFKMRSHDVFADLKHYFDNGAHGKIGLRYSDREADSNYAFSGSALNAKNQTGVSFLGQHIEQKSFAIDASYSQSFNWGSMHNDFVVGANYSHTDYDYDMARSKAKALDYRDFGSLSYVDILGNARQGVRGFSLSSTTTKQSEQGIYGKLVLRPVDALSIIFGGRLGHYRTEAINNKVKSTRSETNFTGYGGVVFDFLPNHSLYASYSMLYAPQTSVGEDGRLLKAREGTQVEGGYKGSFNNDALNVRLSVYRLKDKNQAVSAGANLSYSVPLGKREINGFEAEVSGNITDKWRIHAGYSYIDTQVVVGSPEATFFLMPRHSGNLWTTYDVTEKFTIGAGVNAMSGIRSAQNVSASGYTTYDLMASYAFTPKFKVQVNVENLFNKHYYARVGAATTFNIPGKERNIFISGRYSF